jgi:hypothetical protein
MDDLEQELRSAMRKTDPSPFFEAKVLAAAGRQARDRRAVLRTRWAAAMATAAMVITGAFWQYQHVEEQARGEAAKARLMLALRVTSAKLDEIREKVDDAQ